MKISRKIAYFILSVIITMTSVTNVFAAKIANDKVENVQISSLSEDSVNKDCIFVKEVNLGNGFTCKIYKKEPEYQITSNTASGANNFNLYYGSTYFGYLQQKTTWTYDRTNRPTYVSSTNTFY